MSCIYSKKIENRYHSHHCLIVHALGSLVSPKSHSARSTPLRSSDSLNQRAHLILNVVIFVSSKPQNINRKHKISLILFEGNYKNTCIVTELHMRCN